MTVIENGPRLVRTIVSRAWPLPRGTTLQESTSQPGSSRRSCSGRSLASSARSRSRRSMGQHEEIIRPDAVRRPVGEEEGDRARREDRAPAVGQVDGELVLALEPAVRRLRQQVGAGIRRRELRPGHERVERGRAFGVGGILDVEDERVELPVGDDADAHLAPEPAGDRDGTPRRSRGASPRGILDDPVGRQLARSGRPSRFAFLSMRVR